MGVNIEKRESITLVTIDRPQVRNAVDGATAQALAQAFQAFEDDSDAAVAILTGRDIFCAGADLKAFSGDGQEGNPLTPDGIGPMGPTRMRLSKPVIAAIEGYAVAGGIELACWCDLRVAARDAVLGVFCRRFGVPLIDGGTLRLPRLIGMSRALDLILTGRPVPAEEAFAMGLVNRLAEPGQALAEALTLARQLLSFPQTCLCSDRLSAYEQWSLAEQDAIANEFRRGLEVIKSGETLDGARRFSSGQGRGGRFD